jgi:hypothetical protein
METQFCIFKRINRLTKRNENYDLGISAKKNKDTIMLPLGSSQTIDEVHGNAFPRSRVY